MRILHTITGLQTGGAETFLYRLLSVIAQKKADTHRVVCLGPPGPIAIKISEAGIRVDFLHGTSRLSTPKLALRLRRIAIDFEPDLCVGWMYDGNLAAWWPSDIQIQGPFGIFDTPYQIYPENGKALAL